MSKNIIIIIISIILLPSCYTYRNAKKDLIKIDAYHSVLLTQYCAKTFKSDTVFKSDTTIKIDTILNKIDSVECPPDSNNVIVKIPCPVSKTIYKTILVTDTILVENKANLALKDSSIVKLSVQSKENENNAKELKRNLYKSLILNVLFSIFFVVILYKRK